MKIYQLWLPLVMIFKQSLAFTSSEQVFFDSLVKINTGLIHKELIKNDKVVLLKISKQKKTLVISKEISKLTELTHLIIENSTIDSLPYSICKVTKLRKLEIINCKIGALFFERSLPEIETLTVMNCALQRIPNGIQYLTKLKVLSLKNNNIGSIQNNCIPTVELQVLCIAQNKLEIIPDCIVSLPKLEILSLEENQIHTFDLRRFKSSYLKIIWMKNNQIDSVSLNRTETLLNEIDLSNNKLNHIPCDLREFPDLKKVNFDGNPIYSLDTCLRTLFRNELIIPKSADVSFKRLFSGIMAQFKSSKDHFETQQFFPSIQSTDSFFPHTEENAWYYDNCFKAISKHSEQNVTVTELTSDIIFSEEITLGTNDISMGKSFCFDFKIPEDSVYFFKDKCIGVVRKTPEYIRYLVYDRATGKLETYSFRKGLGYCKGKQKLDSCRINGVVYKTLH